MNQPKIFRYPPPPATNPELGRAVIGGVLIDSTCLPEIAQYLEPDDFPEPAQSIVYNALLEIWNQNGETPDIVQLNEYLRAHNLLATVGGSAYTHQLVNTCPTSLRTVAYARKLHDLAVEHRVRLIGESLAINGITADDAMGQLETALARRAWVDDTEPDVPIASNVMACGAEVQAFPVDVYPLKLRAFIDEAARSIHCPCDFIAAPLLPYLGAALGNTTCIEVKPGWREFPRIWLALVAPPGEKKSPALAVIDKFFGERQQALYVEWQAKYEAWRQSNDSSPEPVMQQIITTDATLEALSDLLQDNPRGVLFSRDELTGWALSMNQYKGGRGADRQNWLSFWNGASSTINRRNRKHAIVLHRPFVGVVGTLQPDVLSDLSDERGRQDGFIHRILFTYPNILPKQWTDEGISPVTLANVRTLFDLLWHVQPAKTEDGQIEPHVYRFTKDGKEAWINWINAHYAEQDMQEFPDALRGPWAKLEGYAARLVLILHICRLFCHETQHGEIDEVSMAGAIKLVDYFKSHVRRVYAQLYTSPEERQIATLLAWIRHQKSSSVTARDVLRSGVAGIKKSDNAKHLLVQLEELGYGTTQDIDSKRGRKGLRFTLNKNAKHPTSDNNASPQAGSAA